MSDPLRIRRFTATFDSLVKTLAVRQYMEQNVATFEEATTALGYAHGVDFLFFYDDVQEERSDE